ncbi:DNA polymerase epsilon catalytic subunit A [Schistosoma japonicum]|nr:DNA polymerase epsilon catalytic subunit A [Schistosoma japonicum]
MARTLNHRRKSVPLRSFKKEINESGTQFGHLENNTYLLLNHENALSESNEHRYLRAKANDLADRRYGFETFVGPGERVGWLVNMHPTDLLDESKRLVSAVDLYFLQTDGNRFKVTRPYLPYFYVSVRGGQIAERDANSYLLKRFSAFLAGIEVVSKNDLDLPNHLVGIKATYLKLLFYSVDELVRVRKELAVRIRANCELASSKSSYTDILAEHFKNDGCGVVVNPLGVKQSYDDPLDNLLDLRESDVPYLTRVCIDLNIYAGCWYSTICRPGQLPEIKRHEDTVAWPDPVVLAFDIETTKMPLKFPDPENDQIIMISYMLDGAGHLICNRQILSEDIEDFDYTPRPEFPGHFTVHNLQNELDCITFFFEHIQTVRPNILVTYNGDLFDWPFIENRAANYGLSMSKEIGFSRQKGTSGPGRDGCSVEYLSRPSVHIDCLCWVKRDSYLPVGARGLKAVTKAKLRYDPIEVDPELMCRMARESPKELANYSVSDAVSTYYLYMKYIHPFVFALCTILPLTPDDVLRKGSGTLCEALLMVQAYAANVIFPHKQTDSESGPNNLLNDSGISRKFTEDGHLIDSQTYVGGHVEALEAGVFRADIPVRFRLVPAALEALRADVKRCISRALQTEIGAENEDALFSVVSKDNFYKICEQIENTLQQLASTPNRIECPVIYHLDVGAMYPNIILTNRLQPSAVDSDSAAKCADCEFYKPGISCQRFMPWTWRAELWTASRPEFYRIQAQLSQERFPIKLTDGNEKFPRTVMRPFHELSREEQAVVEKKRITDYCRRAYKRVHVTRTEERLAMVCQRENSFYVDTTWKRNYDDACAALSAGTGDSNAVKEANAMLVLYDSLQLAHKCILNSFYGYVMRRGARWYSMEMAGIVCHTGANIITKSREIVEQIGRALELDTDGIWCILPSSFPQNVEFTVVGSKPSRISISYPGALLNILVQDVFTNHQYHELIDQDTLTYKVRSENSIYFEVDGPYRAMVLPAAKEEGKRLKKRYAVFNFDGSLAELKGFEIKRNGELQLIKIFQSSVFEAFLQGSSLVEAYSSVASVADHWLDVLYSKGASIPDSELFDLISENRSMSRRLEDYGNRKSTSLSTARRMAEFLGDQIIKDPGLSCRYIIARHPDGAPVTERAIPLTIFQAEKSIKRYYLQKWLKDSAFDEHTDIREILDWSYYIERLSSAIQKIITIPAALQQVPNPVPRVSHPDWLLRKLAEKTDACKQQKLTEIFVSRSPVKPKQQITGIQDLETIGSNNDKKKDFPTFFVKRYLPVKRPRSPNVLLKSWRKQLGEPPSLVGANTSKKLSEWLAFHQAKWCLQLEQRQYFTYDFDKGYSFSPSFKRQCGLIRYLDQTRVSLFTGVWQVIEIVPDPGRMGHYTVWVLINSPGSGLAPVLSAVDVTVSKNFYVNMRTSKSKDSGPLYRKVSGNASTTSDNGTASGRILPRNHTVYHLYEYNVPESVYTEHATEIATDLARSDIEGVYELGVPSLFRILTKLGCLCTVDQEVFRKNQGKSVPEDITIDLDQLRCCSSAQYPYLPDRSLRHAFLFHYQLPSTGQPMTKRDSQRQLYLLIVPWTNCGYVCVIDSSRINQLPDLTALYSRQRIKLFPQHESEEFPPVVLNFEVHIESDAVVGRRVVQRWIAGLCKGKNTHEIQSKESSLTGSQSAAPIAILLHSSLSSTQQAIPSNSNEVNWPLNNEITGRRLSPQLSALSEFPVIQLGGTMDEVEIQISGSAEPIMDAYVFLNWQQTAIKRGIRYFLQSEARYERQLKLARYLDIPVGNIPVSEAPLQVSLTTVAQDIRHPASSINAIELGCDLFYARHLMKHSHILWCSSSSRPDLGGKETDDQRLLLEMEESTVVEFNRPGRYPYVNVELELTNLAVNTLIVANRIPELEGATLLSFDRLSAGDRTLEEQLNQGVNLGTHITSYDETAACSSAFRVLRNMVLTWVREVTQFQNPLADEQIIYFYQWLRSPRSLFYDPALRRTVQKLMKKVFLKLVDELRHFHVDVIYANFSRLIISTHRIELPEALARIDYFTQLIRTRRGTLFTHMDLQYVTSWRHLIWMDSANYAGVKACVESLVDGKDVEWSGVLTTQHSSDPPTEKESNVEQHYPPDPELDMHWHLARYLPEARGLRSKFQSLLAGYLLAIYNIVRTEHRRLVESTITNSSNELHDCRFEFIGNVSEVSNFVHKAETTPYKSDATVSPGVREYEERLFKEQLAPELYNLIIRLQRKAAWINPDLVKKGGLSISNNDIFQVNRDVNIHKNNEIVSAYLADKPIGLHAEFDVSDNNKSANLNLIPPLLPTHQSIYTLNFTPLLDFIKSFCEIISLEPSTKLQIEGIRRDLLRLINIGEFSSEAVWIAPHMTKDCPLNQNPNEYPSETTVIRSLLVYLPEVACPTCNFTRDIDVCRDVHIVWIMNSVNVETGQSGHWSWICPHCRTVYPRAKLEEALVRQLEQFSLQHCLQDLQCSKCVVGGGIQELLLANGGSVAQCSECSTKLILSVPTGNAVYRRLDVYRNIGIHFGFEYLEQISYWLIQGLQ